jgi:hypothetical protein
MVFILFYGQSYPTLRWIAYQFFHLVGVGGFLARSDLKGNADKDERCIGARRKTIGNLPI